jgi:2-oxoisovalerate dehydrogenase E2 component (dihydrolipoyl transacylase)
MPRELLLPELAESVIEGEIVKWLVAEGEHVVQDQPVVEIMTDKVTVELPSPFAGTLEKQLVPEGGVVAVHAPIARFADDLETGDLENSTVGTQQAGAAEVLPELVQEAQSAPSPEAQRVQDEERSIVEGGSTDDEDDGDALSLFKASKEDDAAPVYQIERQEAARERTTGPYGRPLAVPAARKLARELGVELHTIAGSGPNGRIRVDDVRWAAAQPSVPAPSTPKAPAYRTPAGYEDREERVPVRGLRRAIANQMVASHLETVRTLHVDEVDATELVALRGRLKPLAEKRGVRLSYLPFIMKATVAALKKFPVVNSSLNEEKSEIVLKRFYNLGLAVATGVGLVVPVVKDVNRKGILELADEVNTLAGRAREGKLAPEDVKGGTFSITNIGSLGGLFSFPIINVPEAAILGVHAIKKRPVVMPDDTIAARQMLYLSLSFDHRVIDGAEAAQFTSYVIELLGTPESLLLEG